MRNEIITLGHGSGGAMTSDLLSNVVLPALFPDGEIPPQEDAVAVTLRSPDAIFTTDGYVVDPAIFPGGNIGDLAVNGTINDLAMAGAKPVALSFAMVLEEGLLISELTTILKSAGKAARDAGVSIVCGDTKVVPRGKCDKIFITTSGIGQAREDVKIPNATEIKAGDKILINGTVGDHGIAVMSVRDGLSFSGPVASDTSALHTLVDDMYEAGISIHTLRDPTRGGLATVLVELAETADLAIHLDERSIPVDTAVAAACEILGLDPSLIANEGKLIAAIPGEEADRALEVMRSHPLGKNAAIIAEVNEAPKGRVTMTSLVGGSRIVHKLPGELLPRIC